MLLMKRRTRIQYTGADKALMWETLATGWVAACHSSSLQSLPSLDRRDSLKEWRDSAAAPMSLSFSLGFGWARRDLPRRDGGAISSCDCSHAWSSALHS